MKIVLLLLVVALTSAILIPFPKDPKNFDLDAFVRSISSDEDRADLEYRIEQAKKKLADLKMYHGGNQADWTLHNLAQQATCNLTQICDDYDICVDVCAPGSVQVDPWLKNSIQTQRNLLGTQPINYAYRPGTHNSCITKAHGYGLEENYLTELAQTLDHNTVVYIANQQLSLYDQLNFGIRHVEIDIHWFDNNISICHAGGVHIPFLDALLDALSLIFDIPIEWDSETIGCAFKNYRTLNQTLEEIQSWFLQPENKNEILVFMFDDQEDLEVWNKVDLIVQGLDYFLGDYIFTPSDKAQYFPKSWPTVDQMVSMGKHLIFTSRTDYGNEMIPFIFARDSVWSEYDPDTVAGFPICTVQGNQADQGNMFRVLGDSLIYGPFYNGTSGGLILPKDLLTMAECNVNFPCCDQGSPLLFEGAIWTWDTAEPSQTGTICVIQRLNGRWAAQTCSDELPFACQSTTNPNDWVVTTSVGTWSQGQTICSKEGDYTFATPINGYMNSVINKQNSNTVWINYNAST